MIIYKLRILGHSKQLIVLRFTLINLSGLYVVNVQTSTVL